MLRVALFPADETGCGSCRLLWPAAAAEQAGDVEVVPPPASRGALDLRYVDVVVFQRPAHFAVAEVIPEIKAKGVAVVVDMDDDLVALNSQNAVFDGLNPSTNPRVNWQHIKRAVALADMVTVSTPALAERYGGPRAVVLPNCVPERLLEVRAERDGRTIGWGGKTETHAGDLGVTYGGVAQAVRETGARFLQVGPPGGVKRDLGLAEEPETTGGLPFAEYHQALAQLDVTIAPLADTRFNRGKSALKVLEAAALGIPCVASPRPEYARAADEGLCVLAKDRSRDWRRECKRLLTEPALRAERAAHAREAIAERHTYEGNGWRWAEAWALAVTRRRGVLAAA